MFHLSTCLLMVWLAIGPVFLLGQPTDKAPLLQGEGISTPLFAGEDVLELRLDMDVPTLLADRGEDPKYHPGHITGLGMTADFDLDLEVKVRGNFRRKAANCEFPPLKLKFKSTESESSPFAGQKKVKLVTHCSDDEYILREYLIYRSYNLLTSSSFQVRLARITYHDTKGLVPDETHFGFFIEDENDLAKRHQVKTLKKVRISPEQAESDQLLLMYTFMYMIGNRDWDVGLRKNVKTFQADTNSPLVVVPYDFDFCGAVEAPYTFKNMNAGDGAMEWRTFRSICLSDSDFSTCFALFKAKKSEIFAMYENFSYLPESSSKKILKFFEQFYRTIDNPKKVRKVFLDACPDRE